MTPTYDAQQPVSTLDHYSTQSCQFGSEELCSRVSSTTATCRGTIALVDPASAGHHAMYLRLYAQILLELNYRVVLLSPIKLAMMRYIQDNLPHLCHNFTAFYLKATPVPNSGRLRASRGCIRRWLHIGRVLRRIEQKAGLSIDLVFFLWLDDYLQPMPFFLHRLLPWVFPYAWGGLTFQLKQYFLPNYKHRRLVCRPEAYLQLKHCQAVATLDASVVDNLRVRAARANLSHFPDVTDTRVAGGDTSFVNHIRQRAQGRTVIGCTGALDARKGMAMLAEAARQCSQDNLFFVFLGQLYGTFSERECYSLLRLMSDYPNHCYFHFDRIADEATFNLLIRDLVDIVFLGYKDFPYSSNLITKAAYFHKPVIATRGFLMGDLVEQYQLGRTIPPENVPELIRVIRQLAADLHQPNFFEFERYNQDYSVAVLTQRMEQLLGPVFAFRKES